LLSLIKWQSDASKSWWLWRFIRLCTFQTSATTIQPGIVGGYLGIGLDEYGNFSNATDGRVGGVGAQSDSIAVRGSAATNYKYLTGTGTLPSSLDNPGPIATQANSKRTAQIDLSPTGDLSVKVDLNADGDFLDAGEAAITNYNVIAAGNGALPESFKFGFGASTGNNTNIHEVGNFNVRTFNGTPIAGNFTDKIIIIGTDGADKPPSSSTDDTVKAGAGNDIVTGQAGSDILVGGAGSDTSTGGTGADRFAFSGPSRAVALRDSTLRSLDRITDFRFSEKDKFQLDSDDNLQTLGDLPRRLFNSGKEQGSLLKASRSAYADKDQKRRGNQKLLANEAVFFKLGNRTFLSVNDSKAAFSSSNDLLVEVSGIQFKTGDAKLGKLKVADYFV
jgi:serralysin